MASEERKCIQCSKHDRTCQIQGFVALDTSAQRGPTGVSTSLKPSQRQPRIYKRRREMRSSTNHSDDDEQPRVKIHVDRMDSMVARLAREREKVRQHGGVVLTDRSNQSQSNNVAFLGGPAGLGSTSDLDNGHELNPSFDLSGDIGLNPGNAFASALNFDFDFENGTTDVYFNANNLGGDSRRIRPHDFLGQEKGNRVGSASSVFNTHPLLPVQEELQESGNFPGKTNVCPTTAATSLEESSKTLSPLLSQLFNNEMFTRTTPCSTAILAEKIEMMNFSDNTDDATDAEKLLSTISCEPHVLEVLDISVKWWIAWRDQAVAMQDVTVSLFSKDDNEEEQQTQGQESSTLECIAPALHSNATGTTSSSTRPDSGTSLGIRGHHSDAPMSFRDFVLTKLSHSQEPVSLATGLLCVAMSLYQLRPGVDDAKLNISASPSDLADRIVLAVDTIVLCPTSQHKHTRDPGVLLLLMIRAKMFAESNQLRKSWLCIRRALEIAKDTGFTEPKMPLLGDGLGEYAPKVCGRELTKLFYRQRFIGSIMELDRLMSMVLGFPHAEDVKFTDQLAMAVLKGESQGQKTTPSQGSGGGAASTISVDIKMRALRRVVSIVAGRVNDRNGSGDADGVKHRTTMDIQATLTEAAAAMPQGWWNVGSHLETSDPFLAHEHLTTQMWFWQVQSFLHLPFMLKLHSSAIGAATARSQNHHDHDHIQNGNNTTTDPYEVNKYLCLQGCRGMIRVFNLLRSDPSLAVYICSCEDFQGVFSACILMVGLLMRMSYCSRTPPEPEECEGAIGGNVGEDLALIEDIKDIFRYRATEQGGSISRQGLRVLEELGSFLYEDEDVDGGLPDRAEQVKRRIVVLPYFGAIHLELRPPRHHVRDIAKAKARVMPQSSAIRGFSAGEEMACPRTSEQPVEGRTITDRPGQIVEPVCLPSSNWDREANLDADASGGLDADTALQFSMPETNLDWDRFLYGHELAQNWSADLPEWPTTTEMGMLP
ncbi:uncharacterized protein Z519_00357 [Cladophialophora bantiana CBS 173.52]|uniref:Transcription factor domain-containing protein n=1 Tax=Cladophialophora bantiana (strain ATCC 10958 / CBS 173.52 / CDC B-1940 / NIH 8579) TaxID=1442370 RepID=A0A0D2F9D0_CLAB1|nr:uncharacterized protein Z519_00357 [Cladophialophora bantiana CBS 173.52]KIW98696.1 hypothetical protein Z519_00357 [Cladophialophora bantiana CBS 173.52]